MRKQGKYFDQKISQLGHKGGVGLKPKHLTPESCLNQCQALFLKNAPVPECLFPP